MNPSTSAVWDLRVPVPFTLFLFSLHCNKHENSLDSQTMVQPEISMAQMFPLLPFSTACLYSRLRVSEECNMEREADWLGNVNKRQEHTPNLVADINFIHLDEAVPRDNAEYWTEQKYCRFHGWRCWALCWSIQVGEGSISYSVCKWVCECTCVLGMCAKSSERQSLFSSLALLLSLWEFRGQTD